MSREHHHHDHHDHDHGHDAPHAHAASAPGKRTLTAGGSSEGSSQGAEASAASDKSRIKKMKQTVRDAYVGSGDFDQKGILDHKLDAVQEMTGLLSHSDQSLGTQVLVTALKIGAAAAGGALAASTFGAGLLAAALIAGSTAAASELPPVLGGGGGLGLDPDQFGSNYKAALREGWPKSVHKLTDQMDDIESAKKVHHGTLALRRNVGQIKNNMRSEMLDAWVNALKVKNQGQTPEAMGGESFDKKTTGRLHFENIKIHPHRDDPTTIDISDMKVKLAGVPKEARPQMFDRKPKDIHVARTIEGEGQPKLVGRALVHTTFSFGIHPSGTPRIRDEDTSSFAKSQLKHIDGAKTWEDGLLAIWNRIQGQSIRSLGVESVEG